MQMVAKKKKPTSIRVPPKRPRALKRVAKRQLQEVALDVERVAAVLAAPEHSTRVKQAKALGVTDRTLYRWLSDQPEILPRALELAREASAATMITGYRRLEGIVAKGNAKNCIAALKLLAQLRGELTEKREVGGLGGGPISVKHEDGRITSLLSEYSDDELGDIIEAASRGADKKRRRGKASKDA